MLASIFGGLGTGLAALGLYGLLAYNVNSRRSELGMRKALGARRGDLIAMVLQGAIGLVIAGLAIGIPVAYSSQRLAASVVDGLPQSSMVSIAFAVMGMLAVGLLAAYIPARRAADVDPLQALRHD